ncbi:MAG: ABC transporter substrate-binding protein [bacterium]|nr:ABC transporter substrate-binding protein [bacterium]
MRKILTALAAICIFAIPTTASTEGKDAKAFVQELFGVGFKTATAANLTEAERAQRLIATFEKYFHVPLIREFLVLPVRDRFNDVQKKEYDELFARYVVATYATDLKKLAHETGARLEILGEKYTKTDKYIETIVETEFLRKEKEPVKIQWLVRRYTNTGIQKIVGFYFGQGISLLHARQSEVRGIVEKDGADEFLRIFRETIKRLEM